MKLSIIIPVLNENNYLLATLKSLADLKKNKHEIIIVDGGSQDNIFEISKSYTDAIFISEKGRAHQMNTGAKQASGDVLWFLHADSLIPNHADEFIINALQTTRSVWGRFNIQLSGIHWVFRIIEKLINSRSLLTGIATGDQGIFVLRTEFEKINGYANISLMEDIHLSKRLKKISRPACLKENIITSSRRWESNGIIKTVILMWCLRFAYFIGTPTNKLAKLYNGQRN